MSDLRRTVIILLLSLSLFSTVAKAQDAKLWAVMGIGTTSRWSDSASIGPSITLGLSGSYPLSPRTRINASLLFEHLTTTFSYFTIKAEEAPSYVDYSAFLNFFSFPITVEFQPSQIPLFLGIGASGDLLVSNPLDDYGRPVSHSVYGVNLQGSVAYERAVGIRARVTYPLRNTFLPILAYPSADIRTPVRYLLEVCFGIY